MSIYLCVIATLFGLVMGSFINCWAWRYLNGESVAKGRSHCTACGHELSARDLVPVFSWLALKGRCRYCGCKVSARYPLAELACAVVFACIVARYGLSLKTAELLAFSGILLFLSLTDLDELIIPNGCIFAALGVRVVYFAIAWALGDLHPGDILFYVASAFGMGIALLAVVLVADRVLGKESMGGGDLKLFFVAGLYFGWQQGLFLVIASCIIGIVVAFASAGGAAADGESALKRSIPFGPSIAAACIVTMLVGEPLLAWYLSLL